MLDLALAVASTTAIAILLRLARQFDRQIEVIIAVNYFVAALIGGLLLLESGDSLSAEPTTVFLALGGGPLWPAAFHFYAVGIATFGIARTGAWARLSLLIPVLVGVIFLGEGITVRLVAGLVLLLVAFVALTPQSAPVHVDASATRRTANTLWFAAGLIVVFGIIDAWISIFNEFGGGEDLTFFVILFGTAAVVSWIALLVRRITVEATDVAVGAVLGIFNFGVSFFLLRAIAGGFENRSAVAFTLFAASSLVIMVGIGRLVWGERVRGRELAGVATAILAIVALNV